MLAQPTIPSIDIRPNPGFLLESPYSDLAGVFVTEGATVGQGAWLGTAGTAHRHGEPGLHFGVKLHDRYVDPETYLGTRSAWTLLRLEACSGRAPLGISGSARTGAGWLGGG